MASNLAGQEYLPAEDPWGHDSTGEFGTGQRTENDEAHS